MALSTQNMTLPGDIENVPCLPTTPLPGGGGEFPPNPNTGVGGNTGVCLCCMIQKSPQTRHPSAAGSGHQPPFGRGFFFRPGRFCAFFCTSPPPKCTFFAHFCAFLRIVCEAQPAHPPPPGLQGVHRSPPLANAAAPPAKPSHTHQPRDDARRRPAGEGLGPGDGWGGRGGLSQAALERKVEVRPLPLQGW